MLHAHILEREPKANVFAINTWPINAEQSDRSLNSRLKCIDPAYPRPTVLTFLLFDEGQDSYGDHVLWNVFLKGVHGGNYFNYRVILFCSYGSPSVRPVSYEMGKPPYLRDAARVSLWPTKASIGLLLNLSEFNEVVARYKRKLNLHPDVLDLFFDLTGGHVGAVVELLYIVSQKVIISLRTRTSSILLTISSRALQKSEKERS